MTDLKNKGFFIVFEGLDGSGKSTQAKLLHQHLMDKNYDAYLTREPGGSEDAEYIREFIMQHQFLPLTEMLLFTASRYEHLQNFILPKLAENAVIICDRYLLSTLVYQSISGVDVTLIKQVHNMINQKKPDLTIFIDVSLQTLHNRVKNRSKNDHYDHRFSQKLQKMHQVYHQHLKDFNHIIVNGEQETQQVQAQIINYLPDFLLRKL